MVVDQMAESIAKLLAEGLDGKAVAARLNRDYAYVPPKLRQRLVAQALTKIAELKKEAERGTKP